jgi:hypothetical protein
MMPRTTAGIGGITGLSADLALIDDPVKSREEADSEARRNRVWEWFQDDLRTRLRPGAAIVVVQTRWHQDDLSGRLLEAQRDQWRVVSLPAEAEAEDPLGRSPGEMLWADDGYGYAASLQRVKAEASTRSWSALYQQRPVPDSGDYFLQDWLHPVEELPDLATLRVYGGSDYAVTSGGGDFTAHVVVGMDPEGRLWLLDVWRGQAASDVWIEAFCDFGAEVAADRLGGGDRPDPGRRGSVPGAADAGATGLCGAACLSDARRPGRPRAVDQGAHGHGRAAGAAAGGMAAGIRGGAADVSGGQARRSGGCAGLGRAVAPPDGEGHGAEARAA